MSHPLTVGFQFANSQNTLFDQCPTRSQSGFSFRILRTHFLINVPPAHSRVSVCEFSEHTFFDQCPPLTVGFQFANSQNTLFDQCPTRSESGFSLRILRTHFLLNVPPQSRVSTTKSNQNPVSFTFSDIKKEERRQISQTKVSEPKS